MPFDSLTDNERAAVARMMKQRVMQASLYHLRKGLDARTVFMLQNKGLLKDVHRVSVREDTHDILGDPQHPDRLPCDWGPFVFVRDGTERLGVIVVSDLLIDGDALLRRAAIRHLEQGIDHLTARTVETIKKRRERCLQSRDWLSAAVPIYDALSADFFFSLAGVRQCIQQPYADGLDQCLTAALRPPVAMVGALKPTVWDPREQRSEIQQGIAACAEQSASLGEACDRYYSSFGYLPLTGSLAMAEVVRQWLNHHPSADDVWNDVWEWADDPLDPVKGYHAASAFLSRAELVPASGTGKLWSKVGEIAAQHDEAASDAPNHPAWGLRCELARHYCQYLECLWPGQDGERIAAFSWWLSYQCAAILPSMKAIRQVYGKTLRPHENASHDIHRLSHPPTKGAALRYATLFLPSIWSLSVVCQVGGNVATLHPEEIAGPIRAQVARILGESVIEGFPRSSPDQSKVYAFEESLTQSATEWATHTGNGADVEKIRALAGLRTQEVTVAQLLKMADELTKYDPTMQFIITRLMSLAAYVDDIPADELWNRLQKPEWRRSAFQSTDIHALPLLCDLLIEIVAKANPEWGGYLPHFFAMEYAACSSDPERQQYLIAFVVASSLSTGTVSALERVVQEASTGAPRDRIKAWNAILGTLAEVAPPWVVGRIRPLLVSMRSKL